MKYRIEADISLDSEQDAMDLLNHIEDIKAKVHKPTGIEKIPCYRRCRYHECTHDEENPVQCHDYVNVDFDGEKKVHEKKEITP